MTISKKRCSNCKIEKANDLFFFDKRGKLSTESICKRCRMDRSKENRAKKKEQYNEYYRKWRKDHNWKEYIHNYYLRNKQRLLEKAKKDPLYLEKKNVTWHKRKARLLGNGGTHTIKEWQDLKEKYENAGIFTGQIIKTCNNHDSIYECVFKSVFIVFNPFK